MRTSSVAVLSLTALLVSLPAAAQSHQDAPAASQAQAPVYQQIYAEDVRNMYFTAYLMRNFGGKLFDDANESYGVNGTRGFGMALTFWARGGASAELDYSYSSDFLGLDETFEIDNKLHTITFSGIFGPWIHMGNHVLRPYGVAGGGLMRSRLGDFAILDADTRNQGIVTFGGGVLFLGGRRVGVRGDVRYNMGFGDRVGDEGWGFLDDFNYLKGSIGLSIAF